MDLRDELIKDLRSLSPAQLGEVAKCIKEIRESPKAVQPVSGTRMSVEALSEMLAIGIALVDENGQIAFANTSAEAMFGYEQGELENQQLEQILPNALGAFRDAQPGPVVDRELYGRRKDGSEIALQIKWNSIRLADERFFIASITDITERKSIETTLRQRDVERALIFSEGALGDFTWDFERDQVEAHPAIFKLYGAPPIVGPVPGEWFRSRQHPDDRQRINETWLQQIDAGLELSVEFRVVGDDGETRWLDCRGVAVRDESGNARVVHGITIDITARKLSEARARYAEELLRTALQYSNCVVWHWDIDKDHTEWVGAVKELYGWDASDLSSASASEKVVLPADLPALKDAGARSIATGSDFRHEFRIVRPDGQIRWIAGRAGLLRDPSGRVYAMAGVNFDVTDRKTAEDERKQSEIDFRELTNLLPQVIFTANPCGDLTFRNQRFIEVGGFPANGQARINPADIISAEDRDRTLDAWFKSLASGSPHEHECRFYDRQLKQDRWYLVRAIPVRDPSGKIARWIATATDIHDQKTAEERLENEVQSRTVALNESLTKVRQHEERLKASLQEKEALLREIHHRVKNNLQIVSSLLSMQADNAPDSAAVASLRDSERRISTMAMIHEQLYGNEDMRTLQFAEHARRLAQSLVASMSEDAFITCHLDVVPVDLTINQAIPCALILNELLTNALKYAFPNQAKGEMTLRLSMDGDTVTMAVSDQGVGLPPDVDPFEPKTLGLEIVQVLVHQLEGELIVNGPPGACFTVRFRSEDNSALDAEFMTTSAVGGF